MSSKIVTFRLKFRLGPMVAVFKYSSVATCSVSLPPQKMEFSASVKKEFLKKESDDVRASYNFISALSFDEFVMLITSSSLKGISARDVNVH